MKARAYKNLNNGKWSLKQRVGGKWVVVGHCDSLALNNVVPHVSNARHEHVRKGNHREVFAWLEGELCWTKGFVPFRGREAVTIDAYPLRPFNRTERVTFHPFSEVKRGFIYADGTDMYGNGGDYHGSACAYFTENLGVWA